MESALTIQKEVDGKWELIQGAIVDVVNNTVTAPIESFSVYGILVDYCTNDPPLAMGAEVSGELNEVDCLFGSETYQDQYSLTVGGASRGTAFITTMASSDFTPFTGTFAGERRVSGVINTGGVASGLHIFPAGTYDVFASSWGSAEGGGFPTGSYTLSVTAGSTNPAGCLPFIFVRSGVSVAGQISSDDCEDSFDGEPEVTRWLDSYSVLVQAGEAVTATVTADFPVRASMWTGTTLVEHQGNIPPGTTATFTATASANAYYAIVPISELHEGTGGYTVTVSVTGSAAGPIDLNAAMVAPLPQRGFIRPR